MIEILKQLIIFDLLKFRVTKKGVIFFNFSGKDVVWDQVSDGEWYKPTLDFLFDHKKDSNVGGNVILCYINQKRMTTISPTI